jgi:fructose transport system ATP-binding protein
VDPEGEVHEPRAKLPLAVDHIPLGEATRLTTPEPILSGRDLRIQFGRVVGLDGVNLDLYKGEVLAVIGDNGAGKSTLIKCLTGAYQPTAGQIYLDGKEVDFKRPQDAREAGIETVYQQLAVIPALDIASNLYLAREERRPGPLGSVLRMLDKKGMAKRAGDSVRELGIQTIQNMNLAVENLSGGQRQAVAVARAAAFGSKVVVLDEPTAALGCQGVRDGAEHDQAVARQRSRRDLDQPQHAARVGSGRPHPHPATRRMRRRHHPRVARHG